MTTLAQLTELSTTVRDVHSPEGNGCTCGWIYDVSNFLYDFEDHLSDELVLSGRISIVIEFLSFSINAIKIEDSVDDPSESEPIKIDEPTGIGATVEWYEPLLELPNRATHSGNGKWHNQYGVSYTWYDIVDYNPTLLAEGLYIENISSSS